MIPINASVAMCQFVNLPIWFIWKKSLVEILNGRDVNARQVSAYEVGITKE